MRKKLFYLVFLGLMLGIAQIGVAGRIEVYVAKEEKRILSKLSIEEVYLRNCKIHVRIKNEGAGVSDRDYNNGKLVIEISKNNRTLLKQSFYLKEVDPKRMLKRCGGQVNFNSNIGCYGRINVTVSIKDLRDDVEHLKKKVCSLIPPKICVSRRRGSKPSTQIYEINLNMKTRPYAIDPDFPVNVQPQQRQEQISR